MHLSKSKKILLYFFLLIIFGSINNLRFDELNIYKINKINVSGLNEIENSNFLERLKNLDLNNIFFLDTVEINRILYENSLIENYKIIRKYPSTLNFEIEKTRFVAQFNKNGKTFFIGSNGKLTQATLLNKKLPYVFGELSIKHFFELKQILEYSNFPFENIKKFYFFPSKRWDIELNNNIVLKLPKDNLKKAINNAINFIDLEKQDIEKIIDLRVKNQIIVNDRRN